MSTFGIKEVNLSGNIRFFVGEDEALWDWLHADNIERAGRYQALAVAAPEGYAFTYQKAMVKCEPKRVVFVADDGEQGAVVSRPREMFAELPHAGGMNLTRKQYLPPSRSSVIAKAVLLANQSANIFDEDTSVLTIVDAESFAALNLDDSRVVTAAFLNM